MSKRICFAGFEESEIEGLKPALAQLSTAWDCVFSSDLASASDELARNPFDAIVINIAAGGKSVEDLLRRSTIKHPKTLRFVLGDLKDRELVVNCIGASHQFISRPWNPRALISVIERSLALDKWLSTDKLRAFVPRLGVLPGLPSAYFEILRISESSDPDMEKISALISRDPTLTARLLQMVNSPACGFSDKITSPAEAVSMLGIETIKSLVLCLQLFTQTSLIEGASLSLESLWRHGFTVAKLSASIARHCGAEGRTPSDAYTAGLLHNIGRIILATNLSVEYSAIVETAKERKCTLQEVEQECLGVTSNHVGAYLLGLWGMPLPLVEASALYFSPGASTSSEFTVLTVLHVANILAHEEDAGVKGIALPRLDAGYLAKLKLPTKTNAWRKLLASSQKIEGKAAGVAPKVKPARPATQENNGLLVGLCSFATVAVIVGAVFLVLRHNNVRVSARSIKGYPESANELANTNLQEASDTDSGFESITLQGIIYSSNHPVVMINGKTLSVGEKYHGIDVISISQASAVLSCNGERRTFNLSN